MVIEILSAIAWPDHDARHSRSEVAGKRKGPRRSQKYGERGDGEEEEEEEVEVERLEMLKMGDQGSPV
jgi:hypothetical protein